jgi:hypothetical protein
MVTYWFLCIAINPTKELKVNGFTLKYSGHNVKKITWLAINHIHGFCIIVVVVVVVVVIIIIIIIIINISILISPLAFSGSEFYFWNLRIYFWTFGRTPWTGDQPVASSLPTQDSTTQKNADIHASSRTRTHDPSVRAVEDRKRLRPHGPWDRLVVMGFYPEMCTYINSSILRKF